MILLWTIICQLSAQPRRHCIFLGFYPSFKIESGIQNMNSEMTSSEIESVIFKRLPTDKNPGSDGFTGELYQIFKQLMLLLLKLLQV